MYIAELLVRFAVELSEQQNSYLWHRHPQSLFILLLIRTDGGKFAVYDTK